MILPRMRLGCHMALSTERWEKRVAPRLAEEPTSMAIEVILRRLRLIGRYSGAEIGSCMTECAAEVSALLPCIFMFVGSSTGDLR